jgi:hypothetical protein
MSNEKFYTAKTKISLENAEKVFEKILEKFEIAEFEKENSDLFINKIRFGKLYLDENNNLHYVLSKPIERDKGKYEKDFIFDSPEQVAFTDNDVDLISIVMAYEQGRIDQIGKNSMAKASCIFINLSVDFAEKLSIKDATSLFMMGSNLFFGG